MILVFDLERRYPIPSEIPSAGEQNTWGGNIDDFRRKSPFISKRCEIRRWLLRNVNSHGCRIEWYHFR